VLIFTSFYLGLCIWPDAISRWIRQRVCIRCANLRKSEAETLAVIRQAFGEESMSRTWVFEWRARFRAGRIGETGEKQSQEHAHHFLLHQVDCSQIIRPCTPKSQFHILLWRFTATSWKYVNTSSRTCSTKELDVALWQRTVSHFLFHKGTLTKNNMTVLTSHLFLFPPIEDNTERPPFWHSEVIRAESQALLNTLTEHDFQDSSKKWQQP
jgi:hypothetical protein